ncbi:MAG: formate dehydrogenase accessory sulfurtransferase FdhD, partial [Acidobacteriota bacterium]
MPRVSIAPLVRVTRDGSRTDQDLVAVEAPLSIEISSGSTVTPLGLYLRTPGDDEALAMGLLFAEGVIRTASDVTAMTLTIDPDGASATLRAALAPHVIVDPAALARSGVASTACGLCGRLSAATKDIGSRFRPVSLGAETTPDVFFQLPHRLREAQAVFAKTGGLHAAAFFTRQGALVDITEDVGRHNAVDKLIGRALLAGALPPAGDHILVVSGRVAFEIIQKAAMAGVGTLVAVGAPSSLAVQAARDTGITLIGFAKDGS